MVHAHKFNWTTMQAWHRYGGPRVAAAWTQAGVTPGNVRSLFSMGITDVDDYRLWCQACQHGKKIDLNAIRDFVKQGVVSGAEALAWREAGLRRATQLAMWKSRGVTTPEKLTKRLTQERERSSLTPVTAGV